MFLLQAVQQIGAAVLRITIDGNIPISKDARGKYDVLNPLNWVVVGNEQVVVTIVRTVTGDPHSYDLVLEMAADTGTWRVMALDIRDVDGNTLFNQVVSFVAADVQDFFTDPRDQMSAEDVVRQAMRVVDGPGWRAMTAALGRGDEIVRETAQAAFAQMFLATAGGTFLENLSTSYGVSRPPDVGFSDDQLRSLTTALNANKVVGVALETVLETFYGLDATRVLATAAVSQPYALAVGDEILADIDGQQVTLTLDTAQDFENIGAASAREVSVALTRLLTAAGLRAYAVPFVDPQTGLTHVRMYSGIPGFRGRLRFFGGRAWRVLGLPEDPGATPAIGTQWQLLPSAPFNGVAPGRARLTWVGGPTPTLANVYVGDYVNIFGAPFNAENRGIFPIVATTTTYFEYAVDPQALPPTPQTVTQVAAADVFFTRPSLQSPDPRLFAAVVRDAPEHADILLPATTTAVTRALGTAWYLNGEAAQVVTAGIRAEGSTILTLTTAAAHNLTVGTHFFLDDVIIDYSWSLPPAVITTPSYGNIGVHTAIVLIGGKVLAIDQLMDYEIYDPQAVTWTAPAATGFSASASSLGCSLLPDGRVFACNRNQARIFDPNLNLWVAAAAPPRDKYFTQRGVVTLTDGRVIVVALDQLGGTGDWSDIYNPITNSWENPVQITTTNVIEDLICVLTSDGNIVACGGVRYPSGIADNRTWFYNTAATQWTQTNGIPSLIDGSTPIFGNAVFVPQGSRGSIWLTGFFSSTSSNAAIYVLDLATLTWSIRTTLQSYLQGALTARGTEIFLMSSGDSLNWEAHDFIMPGAAGKRLVPGTTTSATLVQPMVFLTLLDGSIMEVGQNNRLSQVYRFYSKTLQRSAARLATDYVIASVPTPTTLTVITDSDDAVQLDGGLLTAVSAATETIRSGYIFDIQSGVALGSAATTLTAEVPRGITESIFTVAGVTGFPDAPGFLILDFGLATQSPPLRYLGVASINQLRVAAGQILPTDYGPGTTVSLLIGTGPYAPLTGVGLGAAYLTSSSVGRIEASADIDFAEAAGLSITKIVLYPGDYGLGNAGFPDSGAQKVSDAVAIWGSDTVDADLAAARSA